VTSQVTIIVQAISPLRELYGMTLANSFTPKMLEAVRNEYAKIRVKGNPAVVLSRKVVNRKVATIVLIFRWAAGKGLINPSVWHGLQAFEETFRFQSGRSPYRETDPVASVDKADVDAIKDYVTPQVWSLIMFQWHSGCRPGEAVSIRTADIRQVGEVWDYFPRSHKSEHKGKHRGIPLNQHAQTVVKPWLRPDAPERYLFSPRDLKDDRHANAKHPVKKRSKRWFSECYSVNSYHKAVSRAIDRANRGRQEQGLPPIEHWHPHMIRHSYTDRVKERFDADTAQTILGHSSPRTTEKYFDQNKDYQRAKRAVANLD
jgi:integrase